MGVPRADGFFGNCDKNNIKNYRTRCSAIILSQEKNILIDTSPDLRTQLIDNNIKKIDKVIYSHPHADQTHGINDLRIFFLKNKKLIDVYADKLTCNYLKNTFKYCFNKTSEYPATLKLNKLKKILNFTNKKHKLIIKSIPVRHGKINSLSFIINNKIAYASDVDLIYSKDLKFFKKLNYFVIDCLRYKSHPSHYNLDQIIKLVDFLKPKKTILTNLHTDMDYLKLKNFLPKNIIPAHDGMKILF